MLFRTVLIICLSDVKLVRAAAGFSQDQLELVQEWVKNMSGPTGVPDDTAPVQANDTFINNNLPPIKSDPQTSTASDGDSIDEYTYSYEWTWTDRIGHHPVDKMCEKYAWRLCAKKNNYDTTTNYGVYYLNLGYLNGMTSIMIGGHLTVQDHFKNAIVKPTDKEWNQPLLNHWYYRLKKRYEFKRDAGYGAPAEGCGKAAANVQQFERDFHKFEKKFQQWKASKIQFNTASLWKRVLGCRELQTQENLLVQKGQNEHQNIQTMVEPATTETSEAELEDLKNRLDARVDELKLDEVEKQRAFFSAYSKQMVEPEEEEFQAPSVTVAAGRQSAGGVQDEALQGSQAPGAADAVSDDSGDDADAGGTGDGDADRRRRLAYSAHSEFRRLLQEVRSRARISRLTAAESS